MIHSRLPWLFRGGGRGEVKINKYTMRLAVQYVGLVLRIIVVGVVVKSTTRRRKTKISK
jgi:hypothetical protein